MLRLKSEIKKLIDEGYTYFISGMAEGADLDFAVCVNEFSKENDNIFLEAAIPYPIKETKKESEYSYKRKIVLNYYKKITPVSPSYYNGCMQKRNRYMVDNSDLVMAVWNGKEEGGTWDTIKYARRRGKTIKYIMLQDRI